MRTRIAMLIVVIMMATQAHAQPSRRNLTACQLFAELELYPRERWSDSLVIKYIKSSIEQIYERGKYDPKVQEPAFALYKASILTKDYGERFANSERQLAQLRRDVADGMTGMAQACDSKTPSRALTPAELEAQTKKAQGQTDKPGVKCTTKTYGGGAAVTVCE